MLVKETESLDNLIIVREMPPLPEGIGDVRISRKELKIQYKTGSASLKSNRTWQEWEDAEPEETVVVLLNRMWLERQQFLEDKEVNKDADGSNLCPVQFG